MTAHAIHVGQMRLHRTAASTPHNPVALRLAFEQRLQQGLLTPAGLPSRAILIIRRVAVAAGFQPTRPASAAWSQSVAQQIQAAAQRALRPLVDTVPHDAPSVLFWDAVELLTCYTRDILAHRDRWYWHDLFAEQFAGPVGARLMAGWRAHPTAIPKTLAALPVAQARRAIRHLDAHALSETMRLIHAHYRLPDTVLAVEHAGTAPTADRVKAPPWHTVLPPEATAALDPPAAYLLGLCYALVTNPARTRGQEFADRAARWLAARVAHHPNAPDRGNGTARPRSDLHPADADHAGNRPTPPHTAPDPASAQRDAVPAVATAPRAAGEPGPGTEIAAPVTAPDGIPTRLGGVFYLVNLLDWLLSVTQHEGAERVNRWELVAGLARTLLGDDGAPYRDDPIWTLLDELAGIDAADNYAADNYTAGKSTANESTAQPVPMRRAEWWAVCVRPMLDAHLRAVIAEPDLSWAALLTAPAVIQVTQTHIDVRFPLDAIDMRVRRAGLDADPGWQPALGYIVYFHFD